MEHNNKTNSTHMSTKLTLSLLTSTGLMEKSYNADISIEQLTQLIRDAKFSDRDLVLNTTKSRIIIPAWVVKHTISMELE